MGVLKTNNTNNKNKNNNNDNDNYYFWPMLMISFNSWPDFQRNNHSCWQELPVPNQKGCSSQSYRNAQTNLFVYSFLFLFRHLIKKRLLPSVVPWAAHGGMWIPHFWSEPMINITYSHFLKKLLKVDGSTAILVKELKQLLYFLVEKKVNVEDCFYVFKNMHNN